MSAQGIVQAQDKGGVQAQDKGGYPGPGPVGGCPDPGPGGCVQAQAQGVVCIPACTKADTPQQTATAADGTHPKGMHSCSFLFQLRTSLEVVCLTHAIAYYTKRMKMINCLDCDKIQLCSKVMNSRPVYSIIILAYCLIT